MYEIVDRIGTRNSLPIWGEIISGPYEFFSQALEVLKSEPNHNAVVRTVDKQVALTMTRDSDHMLNRKTKLMVRHMNNRDNRNFEEYRREKYGIS